MQSWSSLPEEILLLIFSSEGQYTHVLDNSDKARCIIVCKGWKRAAQITLYKELTFFGEEEYINITRALDNKEPFFSKIVKKICLYGKTDKGSIYEKYMEQLATMFPYIETIYAIENMRTFYEYLIHIRLDGKWKFLKDIPISKGTPEIKVAYTSCALVCRDSLLELDIDNDIIEGYPFSYANKQYNRLVSRLEQFRCLESLDISKTSDERFEDFDSLLDSCDKLKTLDIAINKNGPRETHILSKFDLRNIKSRPDITTIRGTFVIDDIKTIKYIMQKFPKLKSLYITYSDYQYENIMPYLNERVIKTLTKFTHYLEDINHDIELYFNKPMAFKLLESIGNKIEYLNICYNWGGFENNILNGNNDEDNPLILNLSKASTERRRVQGVSLNYDYLDEVLPHLEVFEKFGHMLKYLEFEGQGGTESKISSTDKHRQDLIEGYFMDHLLKYCINLKHLFIRDWKLINCNPSMSKNYSITSLTLSKARISTQCFYELSVRLVVLKHLDLQNDYSETELIPVTTVVDMPYSSLDSFTFSLDYYTTVLIGIRISTENEDLFCVYRSTNLGRGILIESTKERYEEISQTRESQNEDGDEVKHLNINIRCKVLKKFFIATLDDINDDRARIVCSYTLDSENNSSAQQ